jgi:nucleoside-diphosphate-sugar epimerase
MKSEGTQYRSWCYVEDCVSALLYILLKGKNGDAYNIADKNSVVTIRELAETIAQIAGRKVVMQVPSDIEKKGITPIKRAVFDTAKLEALGWTINGTMEEKLKKTIDICKAND